MTVSVAATKSAYEQLTAKLRAIGSLQQCEALLKYDRMVFMPQSQETAQARGVQLSALASVVHEKTTDKSLFQLLEEAEKDLPKEDADAPRVLELTRKTLEENSRVTAELAARKAKHGALAHSSWAQAREKEDFALFVPALTTCFEIAKEEAAAKRIDESVTLYDQMLDHFEPGMKMERIDQVFEEIERALVPLLERVRNSETKPSTTPLEGTFDIAMQKKVCKEVVTQLGFDEARGRIDVAVHPFTSSASPADVRITSRFSDNEWQMGLLATIHEGGHAMYEQSLGKSGLEIDHALSMGTHESQSLFWERMVAKSLPFWKWIAPKLNEAFESFDYTPEQLYDAVNAIKPNNCIRVEADELTYPLHVLLRYRLEKEIITDKLTVEEIPAKWNELMMDLLGVQVPNDSLGCLQDIHWSAFAIGYFATYLLGSSTAAQLAYYCEKDIPDMYALIEKGQFEPLKAWLTDKVHKHGRRYKSLDDLLEAQVGEKLNPKYFIDYLEEKYSKLYNC
ncbi:carboxypeptidase [Nitzschia inconspicua]|uniref:Carboxypeptidase n=1 Tax=Nitzschia inconspicua TaxID=303405 RepID=A0A9K3LNI1_9STRA|nr:carboxypeptidase [Nitzschia inconspicua]